MICHHKNIILGEHGSSTCADCNVHFEKSFCTEFTTTFNGPISTYIKAKSTIINTLEKEFGISDSSTCAIAEKIFNITSKNKMVKGTNKRSILCASLYYAYHCLEKPKNFKDMLDQFQITHKNGSKGLKMCQIAMQESDHFDDKICIYSIVSTHKENLKELILKYNIPLKNYDEIEKIIVASHHKKRKILSDRITSLWISCIFFWLLKINPDIDPEEFISINDKFINLQQLRSDLTYLKKNLI